MNPTEDVSEPTLRPLVVLFWLAPAAALVVLLGLTTRLWGWPCTNGCAAALSVSGFLMSVALLLATAHDSMTRVIQAFPQGLSTRWHWLSRRRNALRRLVFGGFIFTFVPIAVSFALFPPGATGPEPVFAPRNEYFLNSHGKSIPVTESTYKAKGIVSNLAWSLLQWAFVALALYRICFGRCPDEDDDDQAGSGSARDGPRNSETIHGHSSL
jgi:hypothetical protein